MGETRALTFDVFGTVVDWRTSVAREGRAFGERHEIEADWERFAEEWRGLYQPSMSRVRDGERPWTPVVSRFLSWNPPLIWPDCSGDGLPGMTEQSGHLAVAMEVSVTAVV